MKTTRVFARVTEEERQQYLALGGSEWLRTVLAAYRVPVKRTTDEAQLWLALPPVVAQ